MMSLSVGRVLWAFLLGVTTSLSTEVSAIAASGSNFLGVTLFRRVGIDKLRTIVLPTAFAPEPFG